MTSPGTRYRRLVLDDSLPRVRCSSELRRLALSVLRPTEDLADLIRAGLEAEIARRLDSETVTPTPVQPLTHVPLRHVRTDPVCEACAVAGSGRCAAHAEKI